MRELLPSCVGPICCFLLLWFAFIHFQQSSNAAIVCCWNLPKDRNMGQRTKRQFSHWKNATNQQGLYGSFHSTDWHLQRWNVNFMSGKDLISGTTKPFAPWLWRCEHWYTHSIALSFPVSESKCRSSEINLYHHCDHFCISLLFHTLFSL